MGILEELAAKEIKRRDFVKLCTAVAAAFSLPAGFAQDIALATEKAMKKPPVVWLEGQDCAGCSESLLSTINPSIAELVLDTLSIRYHETIMAGSGSVAERALEDTIKEGGYVLVLEGSIPKADDRFCMVGGRNFKDIFMEAAGKAAVIIGAGSCATLGGGIPGATPSQGRGAIEFVSDRSKVINLPTCPVKPSRLVATIMYFLTAGKAPALDQYNRPTAFYGTLIHDNCPRRNHFEKSYFLTDWNDPKQKDYCLLLKGCKGPKTYADCPQVWWNEGANWCIGAGAPCAGCSQPEYYAGFTPLYAKQDTIDAGKIDIDTIGEVAVGVAAVGAVVHGAVRLVAGKDKK